MGARSRAGGVLTLFAMGMLVLLPGAQAQWGMGRRGANNKGDGVVRPEDIPGGLSFSEMQKLAKHEAEIAKQRGIGTGLGAELATLLPDELKNADMSKLLDDMMQMPEIQKLLEDPELFKQTLKDNPVLAALPNIDEMLESPEFKDPEKIKKIMKEGVDAFKEYTNEVVDMMRDPDKMEEAVNYLESLMTDEEKARIMKLASGDVGALGSELDRLRGVFQQSAQEMAKQAMDPENLEKTRREFIEKGYGQAFADEKMKAAAKDPQKWAAMMEENIKLLYAKPDDEL